MNTLTALIYPGKVCKSYREVCDILGEEVKTGGARQNQLKRWTEYFEWYKKGNTYNFTRVKKPYQAPSKYFAIGRFNQHISPLLCNLVASAHYATINNRISKEYKELILPASELYIRLGICNYAFKEWKHTEKFLQKFELTHLDSYEAREAYFFVWKFIWETVNNAVESLDRQHIIALTKPAYQIKHESEPNKLRMARPGSDKEAEQIHTLYRDMLTKYECKNLFSVQLKNIEEMFYADLAILLQKKLGIVYHTKVYWISFDAAREDEIKKHILLASNVNEHRIKLQTKVLEWAEEHLDGKFWDIISIVFSEKTVIGDYLNEPLN